MMTEQGAFVLSFLANLILLYLLIWQQRSRARIEGIYEKEIERLRKQQRSEEAAKRPSLAHSGTWN
jgi:hypothetical protein